MKTIRGDLLACVTGNAVIIHGCNDQRIMGAGFAAALRKRYPSAFAHYRDRGSMALGHLNLCKPTEADGTLYICNAITQGLGSTQRQVNYEAVAVAFESLRDVMHMHGDMGPVCFPAIGSGLGGGSWPVVQAIIEASLGADVETRLYVL